MTVQSFIKFYSKLRP